MVNNELEHHGIMGMKWGVHRKNPSGGSSQDTGRSKTKRYTKVKTSAKRAKDMSDEELTKEIGRMSKEDAYNKMMKNRSGPSKLEKTKRVVDSTSTAVNQLKKMNDDSIRSVKKPRMDLSKMTDQQLRERINRENLEKQYNDLFNTSKPQVSKGQAYASQILDVAGSALAVGTSALAIAVSIKELRK